MSLLNVYSLSQTALGLNTIVAYSGNKHYNKRKAGKKNNFFLKTKSIMRIQNSIVYVNLFP